MPPNKLRVAYVYASACRCWVEVMAWEWRQAGGGESGMRLDTEVTSNGSAVSRLSVYIIHTDTDMGKLVISST